MSAIAKWLIDLVVNNWKSISDFFVHIIKKKVLAIPIFLIFISLAIYFGFRFFSLSEQYSELFLGLLSTSAEPTPQEYKGVESFILSVANHKQELSEGLSNVKGSLIDPKFIEGIEKIQTGLRSPTNNKEAEKKLFKLQLVDKTEIITEDEGSGFLFLPTYLLNRTVSKSELNSFRSPKSSEEKRSVIKKWFEHENGLQKEIALTRSMAEGLEYISQNTIMQLNPDRPGDVQTFPKQVYFITKNGINRIFSQDHENLRDYYGQHFQSRTFFPSRPYFWPTFDHKKVSYSIDELMPSRKESTKVSDYFYVTQPYLDLAWAGFVITLTRGIEIDGEIIGVICIDLPLPIALQKALEKVAATTRGISTQEIKFYFDNKTVSLDDQEDKRVKDSESLHDLWNDFRKYVQDNTSQKADLLGNIIAFKRDQNEERIEVFVQGGKTEISKNHKGAVDVNGLFISIDLKTLRNQLHNYAIFAVIFLILTLLTILGLYVNTHLIQTELESAFHNVDLLMDNIPLPYIRLNSHDLIVDFNQSICSVMGFNQSLNDRRGINQLNQRTFKSFCASHDDENVYDSVQIKGKTTKRLILIK